MLDYGTQSDGTPEFKQPKIWISALLCSLLLMAELYALLHDLKPTIAGNTRPVIATYEHGSNEVRNKAVGTISWYTPVHGDSFRNLDTVLTMTNAQANLTFVDGAQMSIDSDSLVVLEKTPSENSDKYEKIIVRLLRGSITRKSGDPAFNQLRAARLPFAVDVKRDGKITQIEDPKGDSIFKIENTPEGVKIEVKKGAVSFADVDGRKKVIEAGLAVEIIKREKTVLAPVQIPVAKSRESAPSKIRRLEIKEKPALPAPKLRKHNIKVQEEDVRVAPPGDDLRIVSGVDKNNEVTLTLEWDDVENATRYHVQVASDPDFKNIVADDNKVLDPKYEFTTMKALVLRKFYYHVASVDTGGSDGPFTESIEIEVPAMPPEFTQDELKNRGRLRFTIMAGASYDSRNFKSKTLPSSSAGSGMIPMYGSVEVYKGISFRGGSKKQNIIAGASLLAQKAEPTTKNVVVETIPIPLVRLWGMLGNELRGYAYGLYSTTSQKFSWNGRHVKSERKIVLGVTGTYGSSAMRERWIHWRSQLAVVFIGAMGADLNVALRSSVFSPTRLADYKGPICEIELMKRYFNIEDSYGGVFKLGYAF